MVGNMLRETGDKRSSGSVERWSISRLAVLLGDRARIANAACKLYERRVLAGCIARFRIPYPSQGLASKFQRPRRREHE